MYEFFSNIKAMALVLGVMILVHEWGHYIAAKLLGVRVEVFAIGFGPRIIGFRRNGTDYRLALLPLGGYVKMAGENIMENRTGAPDEFMSHPRWHRFIIAAAGPFMNIVLAVALLTGVYMFHYERPVYLDKPATIGWVLEDSPAQKLGVQPGDRIIRIDDVQNPTWEDVIPKIALSPNRPVNVAIQRGNEIFEKDITPSVVGREQLGHAGWIPDEPNTVTKLEPEMPAAKAGVKEGDTIVAVNGQAMRSMQQVIRTIRESKGAPITMAVVREGKEHTFNIVPEATKLEGQSEPIYRIGVQSIPVQVDQLPFGQAITKSIQDSKRNSLLIFELLGKMIRREVSVKQIEGPISIARYSGEAARQEGWTPLLKLMAIISLNLGIFNLLPIPILDGGVILLLAIEGVMRRDLSQALKERIYQAAFVFLILFAVMVIYNDLVKTIPGLAQRLP